METYIKEWLSVIDGMDNTNTYKFVWGKSIVEICRNDTLSGDFFVVDFSMIAEKFIRYYWDQIVKFQLNQSPLNLRPTIVSIVEKLITDAKKHFELNDMLTSDKIDYDNLRLQKFYIIAIEKIGFVLKKDVCWRFLKVENATYELYYLNEEKDSILLNRKEKELISAFSFQLQNAISIKWFKKLVYFNIDLYQFQDQLPTITYFEVKEKLDLWESQIRKNPFISRYKIESEFPNFFTHKMREIWSSISTSDWLSCYENNYINAIKLDEIEFKKLDNVPTRTFGEVKEVEKQDNLEDYYNNLLNMLLD